MLAYIAMQSPAPPLFIALAGGYLACGVVTAVFLDRKGLARSTVASSLLCWPLFVSLLSDSPRTTATGPLGARIDACLDALVATLRDPVAGELPGGDDVAVLRGALHHADQRIGLVDRLIADTDGVPAGIAALREARARSVDEIEAVLASVVELRLQVGLLALAGDTAPVRDRLRELRGRIGAIDEVTRMIPVEPR
jgi:hypothetical protein